MPFHGFSKLIAGVLLALQIDLGHVLGDLSRFRPGQVRQGDHAQMVIRIAIDCALEALPGSVMVNAAVSIALLDEKYPAVFVAASAILQANSSRVVRLLYAHESSSGRVENVA